MKMFSVGDEVLFTYIGGNKSGEVIKAVVVESDEDRPFDSKPRTPVRFTEGVFAGSGVMWPETRCLSFLSEEVDEVASYFFA